MESNLVRITCPSCGAPIEASQLKKKIIHCTSCDQTFQLAELFEEKDDNIHPQYIPLPPVDKNCKKQIIEDLICTKGVPTDIFDTLKLEEPIQKYCPFYVYHYNWFANWVAKYSKMESYTEVTYDNNGYPNGKQTKYRTLYEDGSGTSASETLVVVEGGEEQLLYAKEICDYYNEQDIDRLFLENAEDYEKTLTGWTFLEAKTDEEISKLQKNQIKEYIQNSVSKVVECDARGMASPGWSIEKYSSTFTYQQIDKPNCVYRPLREVICMYNNEPFGAVVDVSLGETFFLNLPQDEKENEKITELDRIINQDTFLLNCIGGILGGIGLFTFILLAALDCLDGFLGVFIGLFIVIGVVLLTIGLSRSNAAKEAKAEKESILTDSKEKRRQSAIKRFGIHLENVE